MNEPERKRELGRLEDFIKLGKSGENIKAEVELRKQSMIQKSDADDPGEINSDIETYLLIADYTFELEGNPHYLSKVYMFAAVTESANAIRANSTIANARLQADYERLGVAGIKFTRKFFQ